MPIPVSVKKLRASFPQLTAEDAKAIYVGMKDGGSDRGVEATLELALSKIGGHGYEVIRGSSLSRSYWVDALLVYVNMGDTYDTTLYYDIGAHRYFVGSWGGWVEAWERRHGRSIDG